MKSSKQSTFRVVCAPDKFKGTLSAREAAAAMCRGAQRAGADVEAQACPVADGGEGTLDILAELWRDRGFACPEVVVRVTGPTGQPIDARYVMAPFIKSDRAIVELASAAGLALVHEAQRNPLHTTTFGVGELMRHAIEAGAKAITICLGGSGTVDGGCGLAQALGARIFNRQGREMTEPITGGMLRAIGRIERPATLPTIEVLCDVRNPLLGENGAARVYGPQKGATPQQVEELEHGLANLAAVAVGDIRLPGAGAAGGAGFGLMTICGASLHDGIDSVLEELNFAQRCEGCDLVLTGEGRLDRQSLQGKACVGVARAAHGCGVPTMAIVGSTEPGAADCVDPATGGMLQQYVSLVDEFGAERAMREPAACVEELAERVVREMLSRERR